MSQADKTWPLVQTAEPSLGVNADVVARAEAALRALAGQFSQWLQDEVDKLDAARMRVCVEGVSGEAGEALYIHAHDIKGLGGTYEFPIVTRMAGSLCRLLDAGRDQAPLELINAHVGAIKLVVRDDIRRDDNPAGQAMVMSLEDRVRTAIDRARSASNRLV